MKRSLTNAEMDACLIRVGQTEPFNDQELKTIINELQAGYQDPEDRYINDAYLLETFVQGVHGNPDSCKLGWGGVPLYQHPQYQGQPMTKAHVVITKDQRMALEDAMRTIQAKAAFSTAVSGADAGGSLVNQTIIPQLAVWFNTNFPILQMFPTDQAGGLDYEWNNVLSVGTSTGLGWVNEHGQPVDDNPVVFRGRTNVGMLAQSRRSTMRLDLAIAAGGRLYTGLGMGGNMGAPEIQMFTAMTKQARDAETTFFQGTTATGHTGVDEFGISAPDGFNGLRVLTSGNANAVQTGFYPTGTMPQIYEVAGVGSAITGTIVKAITDQRNAGQNPDMILMSHGMATRIANELFPQFRYQAQGPQGVYAGPPAVMAINHPAGPVPIYSTVDASIGTYPAASIGQPVINGVTLPVTTITGAGATAEDIYLVSSSIVRRVFLGTPNPTPLEIPYAYATVQDGTDFFSRRLVVYNFLGVAFTVSLGISKIRVQIA